jgi:two-component system nitrate/nitrite response regulator NarL
MTNPVVLISPNAIAREGLSRIISSGDFAILSSGPSPAEIDWSSCDDRILTVIDAGHSPRQSSMIPEVFEFRPGARCVILVDMFDYEAMLECFEHDAQGYIVKDMPWTPLMASLQLASLGERILPSNLLEIMLRQGPYPDAGQGSSEQIGQANLSQREIEVLSCLTAGYPNKLIARQLEVSEATVKVHVKAILRKLKVGNRTQAAMWGTSRGITNLPGTSPSTIN